MKILFLTDNYPPEVNAPASRTHEHCKAWVNSGHQIVVITCAPNFPDGVVFGGYKNKIWSREFVDGIEIIRVKTFISANSGIILRTFDYLSFMFSSLIASFFIKDIDVVIGTSPQFFTVCSAALVGKFKRVPWVFEVRDLWPESIKVVLKLRDNLIFDLLERLELYLYSSSSLIVVVTNSFKQILCERGVDENKIVVVTNGINAENIQISDPYCQSIGLNTNDKFVVSYIGSIGMAHGLSIIISTAKLLKEKSCKNDVLFLIVGSGAEKEKLEKTAKKENLTNVVFLNAVSREKAISILAASSASLVHLRKNDLFKTVIPSKIFEAMALGVPILLGVEGESKEIITSTKAGLCFEPENEKQLLKLINKLKSTKGFSKDLSKNGILASKNFDRDKLAAKMLVHIEAVVKN